MSAETQVPDYSEARISARLLKLSEACRGRDVTLGELAAFGDESEDAYFLLVLLLSLPFCQPIPMTGLSVPIGLMLAGIGWAMVLEKPFSLGDRVSRVRIPHKLIPALIKGAGKLVGWLERHLHRRRTTLTRSRPMRRLHGATICFWGLMLALPLPIPLSNIFSALPLPLLAAALLEDDGVMVVRAYIASTVCAAYWLSLGFFGVEILGWVNNHVDPILSWLRSLFA
jgi:hypothetical protein